MKYRYHIIVVGGGMAGLAAADLLSGSGLSVLVIDDNTHTGGQLLRKLPHTGSKRFEPDGFKRRGLRLARRVRKSNVDFLHGAEVLGIYPRHTLLVADHRGHVSQYRAETLILATGARERHLPFKGWTLPGVMSTGAAQILMKTAGVLPGRKTLIGGSSPLMLALAADILINGGGVMAVLDQTSASSKLKAPMAGPAVFPKLGQGLAYLARLALSRIPLKQGVRIVEARGHRQLEEVVAARITADGSVVRGTERIYPASTLAVGYGFSPNIELPQQAGCTIKFSESKGGWFVDVNAAMESTIDDIYAIGETTGIAGAGKSFIEGRIAAWDILGKHGLVDRQTRDKEIRPLLRERDRQVRYGWFLNLMCSPQPGCYADIPNETVICRCEEITMGTIRGQLKNGFTTMSSMKKATRCGMGNCQGRICGPIVHDILGAHHCRPPEVIGGTSARAPVKTVALGALANMTVGIAQSDGDSESSRE
jgi:NADPH-dependent 2,4-dienoyl-CoA reductase/sulfur reductase-like enzyme